MASPRGRRRSPQALRRHRHRARGRRARGGVLTRPALWGGRGHRGRRRGRWRAQGHHEGTFGPVPATGRPVSYEGGSFLTFQRDRLVDAWSVNDLFGLVQQLGAKVVPPNFELLADED
ncbi:MAG: ester cyclase [Nocardioides sp.]